MTTYVGRFAPSPTGPLHLGNARTALLSWLDARAHGGRYIMRIEDLDAGRTVAGMAQQHLDELRWLGLDWDEGPDLGGPSGPYFQSERLHLYQAALDGLRAIGRAFPCICSRKDLQRLASAPHAGEEGPPYPGTCRGRFSTEDEAKAAAGRLPAWRFRVVDGVLTVEDRIAGAITQDVRAEVGDVVVRRADGVWAYQLAVVVDDAAMGITDVVRAADLTTSTPRQVQLLKALGHTVPRYAHAPLLHGPDGGRLQKRAPAHTLAGLRAQGVTPEAVVGWLARSAGIVANAAPVRARELVRGFELATTRDVPDWSLRMESISAE